MTRAVLGFAALVAVLGLLAQPHQSSTAWLGLGFVLVVVAWFTRHRHGIGIRRARALGSTGVGLRLGVSVAGAGAKLLTKRATWVVVGAVALLVLGNSVHATTDRIGLGVLVAGVALFWWGRHRQTDETPTALPMGGFELLELPARMVAWCRHVAITVVHHIRLRCHHEEETVPAAVTAPLTSVNDAPWTSPTVTSPIQNNPQIGSFTHSSRSATGPHCEWCDRPLTGRQQRWCSRACQQAKYRRDRLAETTEDSAERSQRR